MADIYMTRTAYRQGIVKPENRVTELHAVCRCKACHERHSIYNEISNVLTVTVKDDTNTNKATTFAKTWTCNHQQKNTHNIYRFLTERSIHSHWKH